VFKNKLRFDAGTPYSRGNHPPNCLELEEKFGTFKVGSVFKKAVKLKTTMFIVQGYNMKLQLIKATFAQAIVPLEKLVSINCSFAN
jgi:hypothetical protein